LQGNKVQICMLVKDIFICIIVAAWATCSALSFVRGSHFDLASSQQSNWLSWLLAAVRHGRGRSRDTEY